MKQSNESSQTSGPIPAESDIVVAWPKEPQQLFLMLYGTGQLPTDWQTLMRAIAEHFPQGLVVTLAPPAVLLRGDNDIPTDIPDAVKALYELVQRWQAHTGLGFERTALITQGIVTSTALRAVMLHANMCARLFAVGGRLTEQVTPVSEQTSLHWLHGINDISMPHHQVHETAQQLESLNIDFTLDVIAGSCETCTPDLQQRVLYLLQNHVPKRLWREALANARALDTTTRYFDDGETKRH